MVSILMFNPKQIYIFVANQEEKNNYESLLNSNDLDYLIEDINTK